MTTEATTKQIECKELDGKIKIEVSPYYFKVIVGKKTYYFEKETGKFDGALFQIAED